LARIALRRWRKKRLFEKKMLKILRAVDGSSVVFVLSGRIEAEHLAELRRLLDAEEHDVALDLNEVTLVDRDTIRFLAGCEADGVRLRNCPAYIRNWLQREKGCQ
jgi:anti-anti-sigma regulatory factor